MASRLGSPRDPAIVARQHGWVPPAGAALSENRCEYDRLGFTIYRDVLDAGLLQEVQRSARTLCPSASALVAGSWQLIQTWLQARRHVEWLQEQNPEQKPENLNEHLLSRGAGGQGAGLVAVDK